MSDEKIDKMIKLLEEQVRWSRLAGFSVLKPLIDNNLKTDDEKLVYELSDGERSVRDIEKLSNFNKDKIAKLWLKWKNLGLMVDSPKYQGRMMKSFSLKDLGYDIPIAKQQEQMPVKSSEGGTSDESAK